MAPEALLKTDAQLRLRGWGKVQGMSVDSGSCLSCSAVKRARQVARSSWYWTVLSPIPDTVIDNPRPIGYHLKQYC